MLRVARTTPAVRVLVSGRRFASTASNPEAAETFSKNPNDAVIVLAARSPLCKFKKGGYKDMNTEELLISMLKATIGKLPVPPSEVEDIVVGTVQGREQESKARSAALTAGFPNSTPVEVVNRFCSSGLMSISIIANQIRNREIECGLAVGLEHLTDNGWAVVDDGLCDATMAHPEAKDCIMPMGWTSEQVAADFNITREEMDDLAFKSHSRANEAHKNGKFKDEILPIEALQYTQDSASTEDRSQRKAVTLSEDDGLRPSTLEGLAKAKSAFPQWPPAQTTGGNASQLTDGAAVCLLMSRAKAEKLGVPILAKHVATVVSGCAPKHMGIGPSIAIPKALERTGLKVEDVDVFEINEAFSSIYAYCIKKLGLDDSKVNPNGGAIALGHPYGCTGTRQVATGLSELRRREGRVLCTSMCIGMGMGAAGIFVREF